MKINQSMIGLSFNHWTVLKIVKKKNSNHFYARCQCGTEKETRASHVVNGRSKSCGCLAKEGHGHRKAPGHAGLTTAYIGYKKNAENRKISFSLNRDQFFDITQKNCFYCGQTPTNKSAPYANSYNKSVFSKEARDHALYVYNGIDRLDNGVGYEVNNCVPCCKKCNFAKNKMTFEEFKEWAVKFSKGVNLWAY